MRTALALAALLTACTQDPVEAKPTIPDSGPSDSVAIVPADQDPGPGAFWFTISGQKLAWDGFSFPPAPGEDLVFVDGWEVRFEELLVTVDKLTLAENPDRMPTDQSLTGPAVAELRGPWAIDLHKAGRARPIAALREMNLADGKPFDPTMRYAVGFDVVRAADDARKLDFDPRNEADYAEMIERGWTVLYVGTATHRGTSCKSSDPTYDFAKIPRVVKFRLGFTAPVTQKNCQNERLAPTKGLPGEDFPRGVQTKTNASAIVQLTIHVDHAFWESLVEHAPAHFDPIAARKVGEPDGALVTSEDLAGVEITRLRDGAGHDLPWRWCTTDYAPPGGTVRNFSAEGVPVDPSASPERALRDYRDYMTYIVSTQGHLNGHGLCFTERHYPSPR